MSILDSMPKTVDGYEALSGCDLSSQLIDAGLVYRYGIRKDGADVRRAQSAAHRGKPQGHDSPIKGWDTGGLAGVVSFGDSNATAMGMEKCLDYFPMLKRRNKPLAGYLSGGERQMLVISRAMLTQPKLMMLDESTFFKKFAPEIEWIYGQAKK